MGSGHRAEAGRTSPAECVQQGRSRGSICVCCTIPTVRSPLLTLMRPLGSISGSCPSGLRGYMSAARHHLPYLRRPPLTVTVRCVLSSYQQRAPRAAASVAMGRLPENRSRAEARSLGDNVVSGSRARPADGLRHAHPSSVWCPLPDAASVASRIVVPMHGQLLTPLRTLRSCAVRRRGSAEAFRTPPPRATHQERYL